MSVTVTASSDVTARRMAAILCAAAVLWAALLPLAPLVLHAAPSSATVVGGLAAIPYVAGSLVCHQRPDRSFATGAVLWPVCGRCAGLYLSAAFGVLLLLGRGSSGLTTAGWRDGSPHLRAWRTLLMVVSIPTLVSWAVEQMGWWAPSSLTRAAFALPLGGAIGVLIASVARGTGPAASRT